MNKRINKKELINKKTDLAERDEINKRLITASKSNIEELYNALESSEKGKTRTQIKTAIDLYGDNNVTYSKEDSLIKRLIRAFINPFTLILIALAVVSAFTDIILVDSSNRDFATVIIIFAMVLISGVLRFVQETRSGNAAEKLLEMIETT
ncbi:MAG TPA: magnesium-translocating P-type ATPase, partial [Clostridiales bacterium]|nr:magnesium-translocating P-type ATPase [Clostridiales bacterium]